ncbi:MAG TPA: hypothetical protein VE988_26610 [Gemmataceae bacterium]|nr:hypothetical protein [Gemmataceae bacterium]
MTEQEWLACTDAQLMFKFLSDKASERKARLTECALLRRFWHLLTDQRSRRAVEVGERLADGPIGFEELQSVSADAEAAFRDLYERYFPDDSLRRSFYGGLVGAAHHARSLLSPPAERSDYFKNISNCIWVATCAFLLDGGVETEESKAAGYSAIDAELASQVPLIHELFGNPFQPVTIDPTWLGWNDGTIPKLAQTIYDDGAFDRLQTLADALEKAGCDNAEILAHLRGPGPHVRGCWVLDLILGKE